MVQGPHLDTSQYRDLNWYYGVQKSSFRPLPDWTRALEIYFIYLDV